MTQDTSPPWLWNVSYQDVIVAADSEQDAIQKARDLVLRPVITGAYRNYDNHPDCPHCHKCIICKCQCGGPKP